LKGGENRKEDEGCVEVEKLDSEAVAVFIGQAQVDELDVEAVVELVAGTEVDERDIGTELVVGAGAGETEVNKPDFEVMEAEVAVTGEDKLEGVDTVMTEGAEVTVEAYAVVVTESGTAELGGVTSLVSISWSGKAEVVKTE